MKTFDRADVQCALPGSLFVKAEDYEEAISILRDLARQEDWEGDPGKEIISYASRMSLCNSAEDRAWRLLEKEKAEDKQLWEK